MQHLDYHSYHRVLDTRPGRSLVVFTAPSCGACKAMMRIMPEVARRAESTVYVVEADNSMGLVEELEILHLPTLLLYQDGEYYGSVGARPQVEAVLAGVDLALAGGPQEEP